MTLIMPKQRNISQEYFVIRCGISNFYLYEEVGKYAMVKCFSSDLIKLNGQTYAQLGHYNVQLHKSSAISFVLVTFKEYF